MIRRSLLLSLLVPSTLLAQEEPKAEDPAPRERSLLIYFDSLQGSTQKVAEQSRDRYTQEMARKGLELVWCEVWQPGSTASPHPHVTATRGVIECLYRRVK